MTTRIAIMAPIVLMGCLTTQAQASRGPSTQEERDRVQKMALDAAKDPLGVMAADGKWFDKWMDAIPDIGFGPEAPVRWVMSAAKGDLLKVIKFQYQVSAVAYQIQHKVYIPKTMEEKIPVHQAALEGVLSAYESLLSKRPENRSEKMDEAVALRNKGELPAFVKSLFEKKR